MTVDSKELIDITVDYLNRYASEYMTAELQLRLAANKFAWAAVERWADPLHDYMGFTRPMQGAGRIVIVFYPERIVESAAPWIALEEWKDYLDSLLTFAMNEVSASVGDEDPQSITASVQAMMEHNEPELYPLFARVKARKP